MTGREFEFAGKKSRDYGVWIENPVEIPSGQLRSETVTVQGSSRVLHMSEGPLAMDPVSVSLDCVIQEGGDVPGMLAWLRGAGTLRLGAEPGYARRAYVSSQISLSKILRVRRDRRFTVTFECEAWRYHWPQAVKKATDSPMTLRNPGTGAALPLIRVNGSGDVTVTVGQTVIGISDVVGWVDIDCEAQLTYSGDTNMMPKTQRNGDWPMLPAGEDTVISWGGGATGVEITPRWRDY